MLFTYDHYAEKLVPIASVAEANKLIEERFSFHPTVTTDAQRGYQQRGFKTGVTKMIFEHKGLVFRDRITSITDTILMEERFVGDEAMIGGFFDRRTVQRDGVFVIDHIVINQTDASFYGIYEEKHTIDTVHRKMIIDDMLETI